MYFEAEPDVLDLVLHTARPVLDSRDLCSLLCTSNTAAATALPHFQGQVALRFIPKTLQQSAQFNQWLVKNGSVLQSLDYTPQLPWEPDRSHGGYCPTPPSLRRASTNNQPSSGDDHANQQAGDDNAAAGNLLAQGMAAGNAVDSLINMRSFTCQTGESVLPQVLQVSCASHVPACILDNASYHWNMQDSHAVTKPSGMIV